MDVTKLNGIIDAISVESRAPSPSHNNLARLVVLALKEIASETQSVSCSIATPLLHIAGDFPSDKREQAKSVKNKKK